MSDEHTAFVRAEIEKEKTKCRIWGGFDFIVWQIALWFSVLTSFAAAIWIFSGVPRDSSRIWLGVLTAFPALTITIENVFDFPKRHRLNQQAYYDLSDMLSDLIAGANSFKVHKEFNEYMRRFIVDLPLGSARKIATPKTSNRRT